MPTFHVHARSQIHPGNMLLEDESGVFRIFFANTGKLSTNIINPSLVRAMMQSYEWRETHETVNATELHNQHSPPESTVQL